MHLNPTTGLPGGSQARLLPTTFTVARVGALGTSDMMVSENTDTVYPET
jgi:hypothetical protein